MNKDSNKYIFVYSIGLVAIAATLLSLAAVWLAPYQQRNVEIEKKQNILQTVQMADSADLVPNKNAYIEANYEQYITHSKIVNFKGAEVDGNAFDVNMEDEFAKPSEERLLPVFICTDDDSSVRYILPLRGTGLWGPIWGYVALQSDMSTICGAVFDHKGETPGLGAEIATHKFQQQFIGKKLFEGQAFTSIEVKKGGHTQGQPHAVDAISGGTITSEGLHNMLEQGLRLYLPFLRTQQKIYAAEQPKTIVGEMPAPKPNPVYYQQAPPVSTDVENNESASTEEMPNSTDVPAQEATETPQETSPQQDNIHNLIEESSTN
jgi:Na+-transporting NADH:ubiquinone oxidoreductase subunit C